VATSIAPGATVRGDGGLYSTVEDYSKFVRMLLNGGTLNGKKILSEASVKKMGQNAMGSIFVQLQPDADKQRTKPFPLGAGKDKFGLGFQIASEMPGFRSPGSMSWAGIFNTEFWVYPVKLVGGVHMVQLLPFYVDGAIRALRGFEETVYKNLSVASGYAASALKPDVPIAASGQPTAVDRTASGLRLHRLAGPRRVVTHSSNAADMFGSGALPPPRCISTERGHVRPELLHAGSWPPWSNHVVKPETPTVKLSRLPTKAAPLTVNDAPAGTFGLALVQWMYRFGCAPRLEDPAGAVGKRSGVSACHVQRRRSGHDRNLTRVVGLQRRRRCNPRLCGDGLLAAGTSCGVKLPVSVN
jgi:hypothetical protein